MSPALAAFAVLVDARSFTAIAEWIAVAIHPRWLSQG